MSALEPERTRREFLRQTMAGVAAVGLASAAGKPARAEEPAEPEPRAGDGVRVGIIGVGGRGQGILVDCLRNGAEVVAVADVYEARLAQALAKAPQAQPYFDYRQMLERKDLDAVGIATPDHWHAQAFLDAVDAGLDVYEEKPLCRTLKEGLRMVEAARAKQRVVQVGNQFRSGEQLAKVAAAIQGGRLGTVRYIRVWDHRNWSRGDAFSPPKSALEGKLDGRLDWEMFQGNARKRPFDPWRYFAWRWYWDYAGGLMTDLGQHYLGVVHWMMNVTGPKSCVANGGNFQFEHWETPDVVSAVFDYGEFVVDASFQMINGIDGAGAQFCGTEATLFATHAGCKLVANTRDKEVLEEWPFDGSTDQHTRNWLECIKTRREPNSQVEYGNEVFAACHLGNQAYLKRERLYWDAEKWRISTRPV